MKLLKVIASHFKNCEDNFEISMVPSARKTSEDKEYELIEVADGLFTFSTIGVVGKNASGKSSVMELLSLSYDVLEMFRVEKKNYSLDGTELTLFFFYEGYIYKYSFRFEEGIQSNKSLVLFRNQSIRRKKYYKSKVNDIFSEEDFEIFPLGYFLPEDTSDIFSVMKKIQTFSLYQNSFDVGPRAYELSFKIQKEFDLPNSVMFKILRVFDDNINRLEMLEDNNFRLIFSGKEEVLSDKELYHRLSSGTTKGIALYMQVVLSLRNGFDLIVDEIENHFHKTLVENIITLYKDKSVNKKGATLIFATHYCEILDLFGRQDNIYITKSDDKVHISNMYRDYDVRPELLKSKQFYNDVFKTAVNYEALMDLKKELK